MTFKSKLFQYERRDFAAEGVEEPVPPPAKEDVLIPEGGDTTETKNEGTTDDTTVQDPAPDAAGTSDESTAPAADPADAPLDNGDGSGDLLGDPAADPAGAGDDEEEEDPDGPIDYVELDELRVNEVAAKEAIEQKLVDDAETVTQSVDDAVEESKSLVTAIEALGEQIRNGQGITQVMGRSLGVNLSGLRARVGFADPHAALSLEGFRNKADGTPRLEPVRSAEVALEGFRNTLKAILENIVKAIQAAITYMVRLIKQRMFDLKEVRKNTVDVTKAVLAQRQADYKGEQVLHPAIVGSDKYVNLSFLQRPGVAGSLRILNQQPDNYAAAIKAVIDEVSVHREYGSVFSKNFVARIEDMFQGIVYGKDWDSKSPLTNQIGRLFSKNSALITSVKDLHGMAPPARVVPPYAGFYTTGLLGDVAFYQFIGKNLAGADLAEEMEALTNWQFVRTTHASPEGISSDGWLRYLTNDEIIAGSKMIEQLQDELGRFANTVDAMEHMEDELKDIALRAAQALGPMTESEAFFNDSDPKNGWKGSLLTELVALLNSVVSNLNNSIVEYHRYGQAVCIAWNFYLAAIHKKERELLAQARMGTAPAQ